MTHATSETGEDLVGPTSVTVDRRLLDGRIIPTLIYFALPLVGTNLMHSIAGAYMAGWVGHVIGPNGLTAVVVVNVLVWFMLVSAIMGIASASSILIAQAYASGRHRQLKAITGNSVCFVVVGSVVMSLFGWFGSPILIDWISTPEEARALAITFLRATALSILTVFPLVFMTIMIRGVGDSKTPFRFTMFWIGLSMLAQPVFLTGALGVPALGMEGVAHANTAAAGIALVALLIYLRWSRHPLMLLGPDLRFLLPDPKTLKLLMMRGLPMGVEGVLISGVYLVLLSMVNRYGAATSAGYGAATQLWGFIQMPIGALSASVAAMASQNIGAGQWSRVRELALKAGLLGAGITSGGVLLVYALGEVLLGVFLPEGGDALRMALRINLLVLWSWIPLAITMVLFGIVRANGAMMPPTLIMVGTLWVVRLPFAEVFQRQLGADAIWLSFPVGTIMCAVLACVYYRFGRWKTKSLLGELA